MKLVIIHNFHSLMREKLSVYNIISMNLSGIQNIIRIVEIEILKLDFQLTRIFIASHI